MAGIVRGWRTYNVSRGGDAHRTYKIVFLVQVDLGDGPGTALTAIGIPLPGSVWAFGTEYDPWAYCQYDADVKYHEEKEGEKGQWYKVEQTFTTKPRENSRPTDSPVTDPLMEPQQVSGGFTKGKVEATRDRFDLPIQTSSHEQIRGQQNEWDLSSPTLKIEQNVADLQLPLLVQMIDTVNAFPIWGCLPRTVRISNISWSKKYYGSGFFYYIRTFEFEINPRGWDRDILDEGTKVLRGHWSKTTGNWTDDPIYIDPGTFLPVMPDPVNPNHYDRYKDRNGENCRVVLNGLGRPFDPTIDQVTTCSTSPDGAPLKWTLTGFAAPIELTYDSGCLWKDPSGNIQLQYFAPFWEVNHPDYLGQIWRKSNDVWHSMGPNTLIADTPSYGPADVQVTRVETAPGKIHVEFYNASDFTLLGVPLVF